MTKNLGPRAHLGDMKASDHGDVPPSGGPSGDWRRVPAHSDMRRHTAAAESAGTKRVVDEQKQQLIACARCGTPLPETKSAGRPRVYCSESCRKAAYDDRRAKRDGAVRVQLIDRVVERTLETVVRREHSRGECVRAVLADPHSIREVLIGASRHVGAKRITPADDAFWDLVTSAEFLMEALVRAADRAP